MKRVLLLVIDALTAPLLLQEMDNGRYPHFQMLRKAGVVREQCLSVFPSITHAALASIVTGKYPAEHGVVGSHWFDLEDEKIVYFSGSLGMMLQKGVGNFFHEFLLELNNDYLQSPTIFQQLERAGSKTACINFPLYRGDVPHHVNMPLLLKWLPGLPASTTLMGPKILLLGDLLANSADLEIEATYTGVTNWFGFSDRNSSDLMQQLAAKDEFPAFTLAYFPDNDEISHRQGPVRAQQQLGHLDEMLERLFTLYGGLESFLEQFMVVITGDHSQSATVADANQEKIDLMEILSGAQLARAGQPWRDGDDIMPCPNLRSAQLYFREMDTAWIESICQSLLNDERIDQLIYRAELFGEGGGYVVKTCNGRLRFWRAAEDEAMAADHYGNTWCWEGDLAVVDGRVQDQLITFPNYPNAFERLVGALDCDNSGHLWMTARIGHEFVVPGVSPFPGGGSHASLHRLDSEPPLFVAGAPENVPIPEHVRITDVFGLCQACLRAPEPA
ncbi:MAG: alkaline phosphatase family protein [Anaerolineaceae bacterium]|nr:alkaline phosphatase family protein [Anaerolineaceae bacterium]